MTESEARAAVRQFYLTYLKREPDDAPPTYGWTYWTSVYMSDASQGGEDAARAHLTSAFLAEANNPNSPDYQGGKATTTMPNLIPLSDFDVDYFLANNPDLANSTANWFLNFAPGANSNVGGTVAQSPYRTEIAYGLYSTQPTRPARALSSVAAPVPVQTPAPVADPAGLPLGLPTTTSVTPTTTPATGFLASLTSEKVTLPVIGEVPVLYVAGAIIAAFFVFGGEGKR